MSADKRPLLLERFRDDPACRVFLSTDAGAAGLNLQHATLLVNLDLPWNPALLEQRIGRIHRMGQKRPVQIVNFVAKGTIEEGMLGVLAFKRSLSAGILDCGESEIALGGSRLNRFMKEVETITGQMGSGAALSSDEEIGAAASDSMPAPLAPEPDGAAVGSIAPQASAAFADPWALLAQVGMELVAALTSKANGSGSTHPWIENDPVSGSSSLKIPLPPPETVGRMANALSAFAEVLRRR